MRRMLLLVGTFLFAGSLMCRADVLTTFSLVGVRLDNGSATGNAGFMTGTVTIDGTSGTFASADLFADFNGTTTELTQADVADSGPDSGDYSLVVLGPSGSSVELNLPVGTLLNYGGGNLCTFSNTCFYPLSVYSPPSSFAGFYLYSGALAPQVAAAPEPSSLALLVTGVLGIGGMVRRKLA
jgi:hypothetical protein